MLGRTGPMWATLLSFLVLVVQAFSPTFPIKVGCHRIRRPCLAAKDPRPPSSPICPQELSESENPTDGVVRFHIEQVSGRRRALDLLVFRRWGKSFDQYLEEQDTANELSPGMDNEANILNLLTKQYNDQGQNTMYCGGAMGSLFQFVAVLDDDDDCESFGSSFSETHGVIGAVDVHVLPDGTDDGAILIELKNLRVHEGARRNGVAGALVEAAQDFARGVDDVETGHSATILFLEYELDNAGAKQLYISKGFQVDSHDESHMTWSV